MLCQQLGRSALQCQIPARAVGREAGQAPPPSSPLWGSRGMQDGGGFPPCWVSVAELGVLGFGGAPQGFSGANRAQTPAGTQWFCAGLARAPYPSQRFSGASCPSSKRIFPPPMWKSISHCHHTAPSALPRVSLAPQISWALYSPPPCCVRDLYFILIYLSVGLSLSLLLFQAFQQVCSAESCRLAMKYDKAFI